MTEPTTTPAPAPGTENPATPPTTPAAPQVTPPVTSPTTPETPFYSGFEDASVKEWAEGKGWKSPEAVVKSAMNLEKMVGAPAEQVLRIPQDGDVEGWAKARQQLGAPAEAGAYEVPGLGEDETSAAYGDAMRGAFHKAGLTQEQVDIVMGAGNEFVAGTETAAKEEYERAVTAQDNELKAEWGNGYDRQMAIGRNAAQRLEFSEDVIDGIEKAVGYAETVKLMAKLGEKMGEDKYVQGEGGTGTYTPAQAKVAWNTFQSDPNNMKALLDKRHAGHASAMSKKAEIFAVMYPPQEK